MRQGIEEEWEWLVKASSAALSALGPAAVPLLLREIERMESETRHDPKAERYEYMLVRTFAFAALTDAGARERFVTMARDRIDDPLTVPEHRDTPVDLSTERKIEAFIGRPLDRAEIWLIPTIDARFPELEPAITTFFARRGPGYLCPNFGSREQYEQARRTSRREDSRGTLLTMYRDHHRPERPTASGFALPQAGTPRSAGYVTQVREAPKVGRNDPCPCGSGKKYKKCCGK